MFLSTYANEANLNETAFVPQSDAHHPRLMEPNSIDCIHEVTLNVFCIFFVLMVYSFRNLKDNSLLEQNGAATMLVLFVFKSVLIL